MKNETLKTNDQELANVAPADLAASVTGQETKKALDAAATSFDVDSMFEVSEEDMTEVSLEDVPVESEWKFPGVKVVRSPFMYKGRTCYSYLVKANILWNGETVQIEAEMQSPDRRNPDTYTKLDLLFDKLPKDQKFLKLGFQYDEYRRTYSYCVESADASGVVLRVTLQPRNATARDNLGTIIGVLKQHGKL